MTNEDDLIELLTAKPKPQLGSEVRTTVSETSVVSATSEDADNLTRIVQTRDQIAQVKKNLSIIIDSIADNPSLVTRASDVWGNWPTWQKVGTGLALSAPTILAGVVASTASLLILGGATGIVYTSTGLILEDHHACNVSIKQRLKEGILSIADILELTIIALDNIRFRLAEEIEKFNQENLKLTGLVCNLEDQISILFEQVDALRTTGDFLRTEKDKLEKEMVRFRENTELNREVLKKTQLELDATISDYKLNQKMLAARIDELRTVREEMSDEVRKTKKISESLEQAITVLSGTGIEEQTQGRTFQAKLESFMAEEKATATKVIDCMNGTQRELEEAKNDLNANNMRNKKLLDRQEILVKRLETLDLDTVKKESRLFDGMHTMFSGTVASHSSRYIHCRLLGKNILERCSFFLQEKKGAHQCSF
jgi:hypothetical protein